jgi:hypothetical protein
VAILAGCGQSDPPPDAAAGTREKPRLFQGAHTWKKVMDDFFHGQLAPGSALAALRTGLTEENPASLHFSMHRHAM